MNPTKYLGGLEKKNQELSYKNDELKELYKTHAEAERAYNIAYAQKLTTLRMAGEPITLAKELAKGDKAIADLFFKMRIAEGVQKANTEKMKDLRSAIDTYRSILTWLREEKKG